MCYILFYTLYSILIFWTFALFYILCPKFSFTCVIFLYIFWALLEGAWDLRISLTTTASCNCCAYDNKDLESWILNTKPEAKSFVWRDSLNDWSLVFGLGTH